MAAAKVPSTVPTAPRGLGRLQALDEGLEQLARVRAELAGEVPAGAAPGSAATRQRAVEVLEATAALIAELRQELVRQARWMQLDLVQVLHNTTAPFRSVAVERDIRIEIDTPPQLLAAVDPDAIEQVLLNLLFNAFKFTAPGGVVRIALTEEGARIVLCVTDDGPPVPAELREAIFDANRQLDRNITLEEGGIGLSLALSRRHVEAHGGALTLEDGPLGGPLFRIVLPRAEAAAAVDASAWPRDGAMAQAVARRAASELRAEAHLQARHYEPDGRPVVLVVEDSPAMNRLLVEALSREYNAISCLDGAEGLRRALELAPDLIVTDVMMPGLSGQQLIGAVRRESRLDHVPILVLTAREDNDLRVGLLRGGAQDFVTKPFLLAELEARVSNLVATKRARDILAAEVEHQHVDLAQLAREVAQRKRDVHTALEQMAVARDVAERASRVKSNFLRMMSHELLTPISAMQLYIRLLQTDARSPTGRLPPQHVDNLRRSHRRLLNLVETILQYARIESGRFELGALPVRLDEVIDNVAAELAAHAQQKHVSIETHCEPSLPPLVSDERLVRLILVNLLGFALQRVDGGSLVIRGSFADAVHHLAVKDCGPALSAMERAELFEPLQLVGDVRHQHGVGSGLGLALVREMVRALGGEIDIVSPAEGGATVRVRLPSVPRSAVEV